MLRRGPRHRHHDSARLRAIKRTLAGLASAVLLSGCGGDDRTTAVGSDEPKPLTKAEFIHEADRICFATESQIEAAADDVLTGDEEPSPREVRRVSREFVVPRLRAQVDTIRLLGAPVGDSDEIERILEATGRGAQEIQADPTAFVDAPPRALQEAERLAEAYGSKECGIR